MENNTTSASDAATSSDETASLALWDNLEKKARDSFGNSVNRRSPGFVLVLRRITRYAKVDRESREIVLDLRAFFLAMLSVGLPDMASRNYGNEAAWFAEWLSKRVGDSKGTRLQSVADGAMTDAEALLGAFKEGFEVIPSISVRDALRVATGYASQTVRRDSADLRHLFAAMLASRSAADAFASFEWAPTAADLADLRQALYARIELNAERDENLEAWREILLTNPSPRTEFLSRFTNDRPAAYDPSSKDHLGTDPDVVALARMICLKEATTPLSIGIFGGWGAGKSTFMDRLEAEIAEITEGVAAKASTPRNADEMAKANHEFISQVVQIRFNAWQFADANLWASLTAEFFDQLRAGGFSRQGKVAHAKLVTQVNDHVQQLTKAAGAAEEAVNKGDRLIVEARKERDAAIKELKAEQSKVFSHALIETITTAYEKHKPDLVELGRRAYQDDPTKGIDDFVSAAKSAQSLLGQLRLIWDSVRATSRRTAMAALTVLFVLASIAAATLLDPTSIVGFVTGIGGWSALAALGAAAGAVLPGIKAVASILRSTASFAQTLKSSVIDGLKTVLEKEAALKAMEAEAAERRDAAARASSALARYVSSDGLSNPPRLLRYVLEDDPDTKAIDREIGLISRARRLFQAVDTIVTEKKPANHNTLEDVPDRIILYIDDLDRCTHRQVYEVLQAVHLLLAFQAFVVVVAVDVAWIQAALAAQTEMGMPVGPAASDEAADPERQKEAVDLERRKRAIAYLEKIFQLPFWLRPLDTADEDGGSYGAFVRDLLRPDTIVREEQKTAGGGRPPSERSEPAPGAIDTRKRPDDSDGRNTPPAGANREEALEIALAAIKLSQDEVNFLSSPKIGAIAPRTPRGAKRLANVYRLVRARMNDAASTPIPAADAKASYPIVALLAAVETGQPVEVADALYDGLKASASETDIIKVAIAADTTLADPGIKALQSALKACPALRQAFQAVQAARGERPLTAGDCLPVARLVRRYSFNRYQ